MESPNMKIADTLAEETNKEQDERRRSMRNSFSMLLAS
jgi:hypothetical protein